jgi:ABC-type branched-subunit amino acid transport system ATPase component/branched-subunit amino acid ABC-type transport system permease component
MNSLLPYLVVGLATGSIYGLAAVGLVVTYKSSGVFNFSHGAVATVAAYSFYALHVQHGLNWPVAALISIAGTGLILGFLMEWIARRVVSSGRLTEQVVATVGLLVLVQAVCTQIYGATPREFPSFLPTSTFPFLGVRVSWENVIIAAISVVLTVALYVLLRRTRRGREMRAVVDNPELLALTGVNPTVVRRYAWLVGTVLAAISGVLLAPSVSLDATTLTVLVVQSFAAAAIGRFTNIPVTWLGGIALGVAATLCTKYVSSTSILAGLPTALPFLVLFVVLVTQRSTRDLARSASAPAVRELTARKLDRRVILPLGAAVFVALAFVPSLAGYHTSQWTGALAQSMVILALGLLVRMSGQVSLCHLSFAAIGAAAFSKLAADHHVPWLVALILAGLIVVPIGALLAIPAIRLSGLHLALATFGFGLLLQGMFYQSSVMFGFGGLGVDMPMPHLSWLTVDSDQGFYYAVLGIFLITATGLHLMAAGRPGRLLRVLAESPVALATGGNSVAMTSVLVFCVSGFVAGIGGALYGISLTSAVGTDFDPFQSLLMFAAVVVTIGAAPWYALIAGALLYLVPSYYPSTTVSDILAIAFGIIAVLHACGLLTVRSARRRGAPLPQVTAGSTTAAVPTGPAAPVVPVVPVAELVRTSGGSLKVRDATVRYGGMVAVDHVAMSVSPGEIVGLLGPNGAGKTSLFNACSGLVRTAGGEIVLNGKNVTRLGVSDRARRGLGRTFQHLELCNALTVTENVAVGVEAAMAGANVWAQLASTRSQSRRIRERSRRAMQMCGIEDIATRKVTLLSTGQRRLVELARCLAGGFDVLLLDEPSSGLDQRETEEFGAVLRMAAKELHVGILIIEHDMSLVGDVCERIYVLDHGSLIFSGPPAELAESSVVQEAYLGSSVVGA